MADLLTPQRARRFAEQLAKQTTFASFKAINATLLEMQEGARRGIDARFTVRERAFVMRLVKIRRDDFARRDRLQGFLRIEGPQSELDGRAARVLTRHEDGGTSSAAGVTDPVFTSAFPIPSDYLQALTRRQRTKFYLKNLGLVPRKNINGATFYAARWLKKGVKRNTPFQQTARGVTQVKGRRRTFALDPRHHVGVRTLLVYERTGPERDDLQLLYFGARSITIPPRLRFVSTVREIGRERLRPNFAAAFGEAIRTAR